MSSIQRHGYIDTHSSAGKPTLVEFDPADVILIKRWSNSYDNPSYALYFNGDHTATINGEETEIDTLYLVDDYGALNDGLSHVRTLYCDHKRDMFNRWHG